MIAWVMVLGCGGPAAPGADEFEEPWRGDWPDTELPSCEFAAAEADSGESYDTCVDWLVWQSSCRSAPDALSQEGLIYRGAPGDVSGWEHTTPTFTVTDAETWATVAEGLGGAETLPAVDFEASVVVVVEDHISSSCSAGIGEHGVFAGADGSYAVYALFEDRSGACTSQCDMTVTMVVVYAVPRAATFPRVCSAEIESCDP